MLIALAKLEQTVVPRYAEYLWSRRRDNTHPGSVSAPRVALITVQLFGIDCQVAFELSVVTVEEELAVADCLVTGLQHHVVEALESLVQRPQVVHERGLLQVNVNVFLDVGVLAARI